MEEELLGKLAKWQGIPITYAGGVQSLDDLRKLQEVGAGKIDVTIGSALSIFGGTLDFGEAVSYCRKLSKNLG